MLIWDKKAIDYFENAEKYSDTANIVVDKISKYLNMKGNALEIACGLGNISIALSRIFDNVDCFDLSSITIERIKEKIKVLGMKNLTPYVSNIKDKINKKYDLIFTNFFRIKDDYKRLLNENLTDNGVFIAILRKNNKKQIAINGKEHTNYIDLFENDLKINNIKFIKEDILIPRHQPLKDEKDVLDFLSIYSENNNVENEKEMIANLIAQKKLVEIEGCVNYKYKYIVNREANLYVVKK